MGSQKQLIYLQNKETGEIYHTRKNKKLVEKLETAIGQYAKRQRTWFKKDKEIHWFEPRQLDEILALIQGFLRT